ncbi:hypothetical protein DRP53_01980 [candidate division WOR-3 bacterium]|uniref:Exo-alpha-sialidase n=1 Tax=candidate division WOR-3 bacterium TaxID=2052148 RepID=A0A660SN22_UNCW3|nr:MAG: hypothetical protein DRP53_01980 [candidate division WOR-3 bacterium]
MRWPILLIPLLLLADPPWSPDVGIYEGGGNQNETTMGTYNDTLICGGWNDSRLGTYHVGFGWSTDGGETWKETLMIEPSYPGDCDPCIVIGEDGIIYYFWLSYNPSTFRGDIYLTKSTDWGKSWQPSICVTPNSPTTLDDKPWAAIDGNNVFVTWREFGGGGGIKFKRSTDYGQTWPGSGVVIGYSGNGTIPLRGTDSLVYVGWGMQDVRFNKSTDMGRTWQGEKVIISVSWSPPSTNFRLNNIPSFGMSRDRSIIYVVFADSRLASNQLDIFFSRSTDQGETWMTPIKINDNPSSPSLQCYPWLTVDPQDRIHVVWFDSRDGSSVNHLAQYYAYSTDQGLTWSQNYRVSDSFAYAGTFIGDYNSCASSADHVYSIWCDCRNGSGNPDIFFSKAPNPVMIETEKERDVEEPLLSFPNPFRDGDRIVYPEDGVLEIYTQDGRRVKSPAVPGIYFLLLKRGKEVTIKKMVRIN